MADVDVVVIGAATAGLEAAVAAKLHGAGRVLVLEKAPLAEAGGNARFSHAGFRFPYAGAREIRSFLPEMGAAEFARFVFEPYSAEEYLADIARLSEGRAEPGMARTLAEGANRAVHWMRELGIRWTPNRSVPVHGRLYVERGLPLQAGWGSQGGVAQLDDWRRIAARLGVEVEYSSSVCGLGRTGGHLKVHIRPRRGGEKQIHVRHVVLASGGFQASRSRRLERLGPAAADMIVRGSRYDTGEVLDYALDLGAARSGEWGGATVSPVDGSMGGEEIGNRANRYSYQYGITVNSHGERFFDEGQASHSYSYATVGWALAQQPSAEGFQIFDTRAFPYLKHYAYKYAEPAVADSIEKLAAQLSLPAAKLTRTVREFNAAVPELPPFDPTAEDHRSTVGLRVPKSNWANKIDVPPYYGYPVTAGITFTYGGLKVDTHARVLDEESTPITGLYASGDILGIFSTNYPSGSGQTRNVVFSLAAGRHIGHQGH